MDTLLEFISSSDRSKCGYCKNERGERRQESAKKDEEEGESAQEEGEAGEEEQTNSSVTTGSAWAHKMLTKDYAALLDMGWRRSGRYLYKPHNEVTCCPQYTIRLDITKFKMSRTQKRVMRQMNEFLATGKRPAHGGAMEVDKEDSGKTQSTSTSSKSAAPTTSATQDTTPVAKKVKDADRPVLKKKEIRNAKFEEKCRKKNLDPEVVRAERRQKDAARQRTIQSYIDEVRPDWKHKLEVKLVPLGSDEFSARDNESFELYKKYQATIHNDESRLAGFRRFLCDSPLKAEKRDGVNLGTFHLWFLLDDKLIAVCVVDVLPKCLSAKYMYYNTEYSFLSIGTYTALREIQETMNLEKISKDLKYYYMGYYIHTCPKMRYKAKFHPSDLLCEQSSQWLEIDKCRPLLDASTAPNGFAVFRPECPRPESMPVDQLIVLSNRSITRLRRVLNQNPELADDEELKKKTETIVKLMGPNIRDAVFYFSELND